MAKKNPYGRVLIEGVWHRKLKTGKPGVALPRASGTMSEAEYKGWVLSGLRNLTKYWKPASDAWKLNTRSNLSGIGRHKTEHQCVMCLQWFPKKSKKNIIGVELDHIITIGGLSCLSKAGVWIERAFVEIEGYQKLCNICHKQKSLKERIK